MQKGLETLEQIAAEHEGASSGAGGSEARAFPRVTTCGDLFAELRLPGSPSFLVRLRDLSRGGVAVFSEWSLQRNEQFVLVVQLSAADLLMHCCVNRCYFEPASDRFVVCAQFTKVQKVCRAGLPIAAHSGQA